MKDKFNREIDYLRISVTDNCNLRCIYCMEENHKEFLKDNEKLSCDEIYKIVDQCAKFGIKKIRLTGGEPLVRPDIVKLIGKINEIKGIEEIYLTTNGIFLLYKIEELVKNGLKGVNISLDSLQEEGFEKITRVGLLSKVLDGIDKCINLGVKVKLNTVLVDDINREEIMDFVNLTFNAPIDVRFIELMPIGIGSEHKGVPNEEVMKVIKLNYKEVEEVMKNKSGGPATYIKVNGAIGKVGFISPLSNCFCNECNRIRITADGFLKKCLHFDYGVDLREVLRKGISNEEFGAVIYNNIFNKPEKHLFMEKSEHKEIRYMNEIGG